MKLIDRDSSLELICGSMYSGKSEELIRRLRRMIYAKKSVLCFKHAIDKRYGMEEDVIVTHNKNTLFAIPIQKSSDLLDHILPDTEVVGIDEIQFFDEGIVDVVKILSDRGIKVIMAGLDQDFKAEPFGFMPILMAISEKVDKLQAVCMVCGADANRSQRIINGAPAPYDSPIVLVGAVEAYEARCSRHHIVPKLEVSTNE